MCGFFVMEDKRLKELETKRRKLERADKARAAELESTAQQAAQPNTTVEQIDYAERTRQWQAEQAEAKANAEAMAEQTGSSVMNEADYIVYDPNFRKLADFIGIDMSDLKKYTNELSLLMDWARTMTGSEDILDNLLHIKGLKRTLGFQEVGPTMLKKLYQYIRLDLDGKRSEEPDLVEIKKEKELIRND